ncbi:hypothetical protein Pr1d_32940 [Bythopirellula goksoeyrii]|uniref:Uncharacterized protein n=1 Tax=Bythopirellula goksoeyrii TaxID=1400387 RepID=A0A5B9QEG6_9BACT|nr:hypothetical protein Pr1d_32940 [Bythopirellula goksoeyrii]
MLTVVLFLPLATFWPDSYAKLHLPRRTAVSGNHLAQIRLHRTRRGWTNFGRFGPPRLAELSPRRKHFSGLAESLPDVEDANSARLVAEDSDHPYRQSAATCRSVSAAWIGNDLHQARATVE